MWRPGLSDNVEPKSQSMWFRYIDYVSNDDFNKCIDWLVSSKQFASKIDATRYMQNLYFTDRQLYKKMLSSFFTANEFPTCCIYRSNGNLQNSSEEEIYSPY